MSHERLVQSAKRVIEFTRSGTLPLAPDVMRVPSRTYLDPDRWQLEIDRIFRRMPLVLGFSCEVAAPHSYRSLDVLGVPVLLVRGGDGVLRSFVNSCSHRGAIVVPEGSGVARRFTCPYHAWNYDTEGALVGILDRDTFGDIDVDCHGLTALPVEERAGIVFGGVVPGTSFDLDLQLGGYDSLLELLGLVDCTLVGTQTVEGPNWKLCYDGYLDFYHLPILHKDTFGPTFPNKMISEAWGPHQRTMQPDPRLLRLDGVPEADWPVRRIDGGIWTIFPHVSVAPFDAGGRYYMVSVLMPGPTHLTSTTTQYFLVPGEPDEARVDAVRQQMEFLLRVVRDEDYFTCSRIQRALAAGAKEHVVFGRNEEPCQLFHRWVEALVAADSDAAFDRLFAQGLPAQGLPA